MSAYLAWGSIYSPGNPPQTSPYLPGNSGLIASTGSDGFTFANLSCGVESGSADITIFFTPVGGERGTRDALTVSPGSPAYFEAAYYQPGMFEIVGESAGEPLPKKLIAVVTGSLDGGSYGSLAWYEEDAEPPISEFWTNFRNAEEVQS